MYFSIFTFFRDLIFRNFFLKLISLFLAVLIWFVLSSYQGVEKIVEVPVVIVNKPKTLEISNNYVKSVLVQLRSTPLAPKDFTKNLTATIDLKNSIPGELVFKLTKKNLNLPSGVEVINIRPSSIVLKLERLVKKKVPVVVRYSGMPSRGYEITNISVSPAWVFIEGPLSKISKIKSLFTETIDISGLKSNFSGSGINLVLNSPYINFVGSGKVNVVIFIEEKKISRYYRNVKIKVLSGGRRYRINRLYVDVVVKVPISLRKEIKKSDILVVADVSKVKVFRKYVSVELKGVSNRFSDRVKVEKIFPKSIKIKVY